MLPTQRSSPPRPIDWASAIGSILRDPARLVLHYQPIVSLTEATVVGYEALSRFPAVTGPTGTTVPTPDVWFAAADELGHGAELEALVIERCLDQRGSLPADCFLTVNVSPHLVTDPVISDLLLKAGPLTPLVLEFTEHQAVQDVAPLVRLRDAVAERGGLLALDDAGSGYSGLQQMTQLRPHLIKLDRALVQDADRDEVKLALVELLGQFASRIDAWLLAEGVETWAEVEAFSRMGVPLAQGYVLGRPAPAWPTLAPEVVDRLKTITARSSLHENVASLVENGRITYVGPPEARRLRLEPHGIGVLVTDAGRPESLVLARRPLGDGDVADSWSSERVAPVSLRVPQSAHVVEVARRMMARGEDQRFDPVVCIDEQGRLTGIIRVERVMMRLVELREGGMPN